MPNSLPFPPISLIAAVARNGAIGKDNRLLMALPGDLPRFKRLTSGAAVVMGRKTWDSIGRPLPGRRCVVVTRNPAWHAAGAERAESLEAALVLPVDAPGAAEIFVVGGGEIYALALPRASRLLLTEIDADLDGDTFFPRWKRDEFMLTESETRTTPVGVDYHFNVYQRKSGI